MLKYSEEYNFYCPLFILALITSLAVALMLFLNIYYPLPNTNSLIFFFKPDKPSPYNIFEFIGFGF